MNILYLADPNLIHDIKWISPFSDTFNCYLIVRRHHYKIYGSDFLIIRGREIPIIGVVDDVSTFWFWKNLKGGKTITKLINEYNIDLFHILYAEPNALWALWKKEFDVPIVLTTRGTDILHTIPAFSKKSAFVGRLILSRYKKAFCNVDRFTCTSLRQRESLSNFVNKNRLSDIKIIRTGIDIDQMLLEESSNDLLEEGRRFILMPRNMKPLYNHELLIEALQHLPIELKAAFTFVFVNADAKDQAYVKKIKKGILEAGVNGVFFPTLSQRQLWGLMKRADLAVMTPISDGSPVSAMEVLFCGTPLILGPLDYDDDIFGQGVYKLQSWNPAELATTINIVLSQNNTHSCDKARERVMLYGDRRHEMEKIRIIYNELLREQKHTCNIS